MTGRNQNCYVGLGLVIAVVEVSNHPTIAMWNKQEIR